MNQTMNHAKSGNGDHVDVVLKRFFRAEMPHPWPECEASAQASEAPMPRRYHVAGRFALAASVVLFALGYFALAQFFPRNVPNATADGPDGLANKPGKTHHLQQK